MQMRRASAPCLLSSVAIGFACAPLRHHHRRVHLDTALKRKHRTITGIEETVVFQHRDGCDYRIQRAAAGQQDCCPAIDRRDQTPPALQAFRERRAAPRAAVGD